MTRTPVTMGLLQGGRSLATPESDEGGPAGRSFLPCGTLDPDTRSGPGLQIRIFVAQASLPASCLDAGSDLLIPWNYAELSRDSVGAQLVCARSVTMRGGRTQGAPLRRRIGQTPVGGHRPPQVNQLSTPAQLFSTTRAHPPGGIRRSEAGSLRYSQKKLPLGRGSFAS